MLGVHILWVRVIDDVGMVIGVFVVMETGGEAAVIGVEEASGIEDGKKSILLVRHALVKVSERRTEGDEEEIAAVVSVVGVGVGGVQRFRL